MLGLLAGTRSTVVPWPVLAYVALASPYLASPALPWPALPWPVLARTSLVWPAVPWPALAIAIPDTATRHQLDTTGLQAKHRKWTEVTDPA